MCYCGQVPESEIESLAVYRVLNFLIKFCPWAFPGMLPMIGTIQVNLSLFLNQLNDHEQLIKPF